jgi:hypothetical protein
LASTGGSEQVAGQCLPMAVMSSSSWGVGLAALHGVVHRVLIAAARIYFAPGMLFLKHNFYNQT